MRLSRERFEAAARGMEDDHPNNPELARFRAEAEEWMGPENGRE